MCVEGVCLGYKTTGQLQFNVILIFLIFLIWPVCYVPLLCALSNVPICGLIKMPGTEPRLSPTAEDEPLSTDPANWPSHLTDRIRTELVRRGPSKVPPGFVFRRNDSDGRSCHHQYFKKTLVSGEKMARSWLIYSMKNNSLFCFCCKLFSKRNINLTSAGMANWKHASDYLTSHENSPEHLNCMKAWKELSVRLKSGKTIDKLEMALLEAERVRWRAVLTRLAAIVQSLAVRNLALRGHTETLFTPSNGNFLKEVELMARFDPIMKDHLNRVERGTASHNSYLGHHVQNELIDLLSSKIISAIVDDIKQAKFFLSNSGLHPRYKPHRTVVSGH